MFVRKIRIKINVAEDSWRFHRVSVYTFLNVHMKIPEGTSLSSTSISPVSVPLTVMPTFEITIYKSHFFK